VRNPCRSRERLRRSIRSREERLVESLQQLPDYNYAAEAERLFAGGKYAEAKILCRDVAEGGFPDAQQVLELEKRCDEKLSSFSGKLWRITHGFISGNPGTSFEGAAAAIASDMMLYGDVRDFSVNVYYKISGNDNFDGVVTSLAALGLATEVIDAVDWMPALLKALHRTSSLTPKLASKITKVFRASVKSASVSDEAKDIVKSFGTLYRRSGFIRTRRIVRSIENSADLSKSAALVRISKTEAHLLATSAGREFPQALAFISSKSGKSGRVWLRHLALKGPSGVTLALRASKSWQKGTIRGFADESIEALLSSYGRSFLLQVTGVIFALGVFLTLVPLSAGRKKKKQCAAAAGEENNAAAGENADTPSAPEIESASEHR
jgi:hypothetical protein